MNHIHIHIQILIYKFHEEKTIFRMWWQKWHKIKLTNQHWRMEWPKICRWTSPNFNSIEIWIAIFATTYTRLKSYTILNWCKISTINMNIQCVEHEFKLNRRWRCRSKRCCHWWRFDLLSQGFFEINEIPCILVGIFFCRIVYLLPVKISEYTNFVSTEIIFAAFDNFRWSPNK